MKKFKNIIIKILLFVAFSLICMGIVKADTITKELYYGTRAMTKLENYETLLSNAIQYLKDNSSTIDSLNSNINLTDDENVVKFDLTYSLTLTSPLRVQIIYNMTNSLIYQSGRYPYYYISNIYYYSFTLNFDSNYNITGYNVGSLGYEQVTFSYSSNPNGGLYENFYLDYRLGKNSTLNFTNNTSDNANFLIGPQNNQFEFNYGDNITLFDFAKYLSGVGEPTPPQLLEPVIVNNNGYSEVTFEAINYTTYNIEDYNIIIHNNTLGINYYMQPTLDGNNAIYKLKLYENSSINYYILDIENNEILDNFLVNVNINFENEQIFTIKINSIDNQNNTINYSYIPNENNDINNYTCYHKINGYNEVLDNNCVSSDNNYTLNIGGNKNVDFLIYDSNNNLIYRHNENFIFDLGQTYITFNETYINNFVNLDIIINSYVNNYVVKYSINNGQLYSATLQDYPSYYNDKKIFSLNNLTKNDIINIYVYDSNNNIVATGQYTINIYRNYDAWNTKYNIKDIFNAINIKNISQELFNYIKQIGEIIINSKIGNLLFLEFSCLVIYWVLKMIRR